MIAITPVQFMVAAVIFYIIGNLAGAAIVYRKPKEPRPVLDRIHIRLTTNGECYGLQYLDSDDKWKELEGLNGRRWVELSQKAVFAHVKKTYGENVVYHPRLWRVL